MHAVLVTVSIGNFEAAEAELREGLVPMVSSLPGFVSGVWFQVGEGTGQSVIVFETEDAAAGFAARVRENAPSTVTVENVSVVPVVARA